jgi:D-ribulokinase
MQKNTGWRLMPDADLFLGLDIGTSGARAVVIDDAGRDVATGMAAMGSNTRDPQVWWRAACDAMQGALAGVERSRIVAMSVDGTSGSMVAVDAQGIPLADGLMYNDPCADASILDAIAMQAPATSAALGPTSGLARAFLLQSFRPHKVLHQADWIAFQLSGQMGSDANNALKTGYDAEAGQWGGWMAATGLDMALLPDVVTPGTPVGTITQHAAQMFGLPGETHIVAGTTDGCASFLATGASQPGDGVTVLGTTLTLKILSDQPIFAPEYGIYSHRILGMWLAGGASNAGGAALLAFFTADEMARLSPQIDPETDTGLDYYPLPRMGERFPIADPRLVSRTSPRPESRAQFLQGLFEGIAAIEAQGYARLAELGAPRLTSVRSTGGGAANTVWTRLRARKVGVPMVAPDSDAAAHGAALLARWGAA